MVQRLPQASTNLSSIVPDLLRQPQLVLTLFEALERVQFGFSFSIICLVSVSDSAGSCSGIGSDLGSVRYGLRFGFLFRDRLGAGSDVISLRLRFWLDSTVIPVLAPVDFRHKVRSGADGDRSKPIPSG